MAPCVNSRSTRSMSASAMTSAGLLPPSSSWYFMWCFTAACATDAPAALPPVNVTAFAGACNNTGPRADPRPRDLGRGQQQREVPGRDRDDDAQGHPPRERPLAGRIMPGLHLPDGAVY